MLTSGRDPLAFPTGVTARFDPSHIAGANPYFSFVPIGQAFVDVCRPFPPLTNSSTYGKVISPVGPAPFFDNFQETTFGGYPTRNQEQATAAGIFKFTGLSASTVTFIKATTGGCGYFQSTSANLLTWTVPGVSSYVSAYTFLVDVPYFVAVSEYRSAASDSLRFCVKRLDTGGLYTEVRTSTNSARTSPSGGITIGGAGTVNKFYAAAFMYSEKALSIAELVKWSKNPWSFWYDIPDAA